MLAGGHSLIPMMKLRLAQPGVLVDINGLKVLVADDVADVPDVPDVLSTAV